MNEGFRYTQGISQIPVRSAMREGAEVLETARKEALNGKPEHLAELMYGSRMGNNQPGDGFKYHGRAYMQLTGKDNYRDIGERIGVDLLSHPELAAAPEYVAKIAVEFWKTNVPHQAREDVRAATLAINNGLNGIAERQNLYRDLNEQLTPLFLEHIKQNIAVPTTDKAYRNKYDIEAQVISLEITKTAQTLIADATHHVKKWVADNGLQWNEQFNQAAHSVASAAHEKGMTGINLFAVNGGQIDFGHKEGFMLKTSSVETAIASNTDIAQNLQAMSDVDRMQSQTHSHTQQQAHTQTNERSGLKVG